MYALTYHNKSRAILKTFRQSSAEIRNKQNNPHSNSQQPTNGEWLCHARMKNVGKFITRWQTSPGEMKSVSLPTTGSRIRKKTVRQEQEGPRKQKRYKFITYPQPNASIINAYFDLFFRAHVFGGTLNRWQHWSTGLAFAWNYYFSDHLLAVVRDSKCEKCQAEPNTSQKNERKFQRTVK